LLTEMNAVNATATDDPHRADPRRSLHALEDEDRAAVLLRYFDNKSLREVGEALDAAKRPRRNGSTRAIERFENSSPNAATPSARSGLVVVITATPSKPRQSLAATISTAAVCRDRHRQTATATHESHRYELHYKKPSSPPRSSPPSARATKRRQAFYLQPKFKHFNNNKPAAEQIHQLQRERDEAKKAPLADHSRPHKLTTSVPNAKFIAGRIVLQLCGRFEGKRQQSPTLLGSSRSRCN